MKHDSNAKRISGQLGSKGRVDYPRLKERARRLEDEGQVDLAVALYRGWIQQHPQHDQLAEAWIGLAQMLSRNKDHAGACDAFARVRDMYFRISELTNAQYHMLLAVHCALGVEYECLGAGQKAIEHWRWVIKSANAVYSEDARKAVRKYLMDALNRAGNLYHQAGQHAAAMRCQTLIQLESLNQDGVEYDKSRQYAEALRCYTLSLGLQAEQPLVISSLIATRQKACLWPVDAALGELGTEQIRERAAGFPVLNLSDDPGFQLSAARKWAAPLTQSAVRSHYITIIESGLLMLLLILISMRSVGWWWSFLNCMTGNVLKSMLSTGRKKTMIQYAVGALPLRVATI
jgi:tetratricopeptide (TPR) repeat protein